MLLPINNPFTLGKFIYYVILAVITVLSISCPKQINAQTQVVLEKEAVVFTEKDRQSGLKYLKETKDKFVKEISGLSESQLNFKSSPEKWSIAEVAEHIIIAEDFVFSLITDKVVKAPAPIGKENFRINDQAIIAVATNRNIKVKTGEILEPNGRWKTKNDLLNGFEKTREKTVLFFETTKEDLRNHFAVNPVIGMVDAYQWFIFLTAHSERHLAQIEELKTNPKFPKQ